VGVAEAGASRTAARAEFEAVYIRLASNLARAEVRLQRAIRRKKDLERDVIPLVREQIQEIKALAALGEFDSLLLLEAVTRAIDTRRDILEARLEESLASNQVNYLLGPLSTSEPLPGEE
jgi:outer membrane protein TolC